jgi:hypothetical protein
MAIITRQNFHKVEGLESEKKFLIKDICISQEKGVCIFIELTMLL